MFSAEMKKKKSKKQKKPGLLFLFEQAGADVGIVETVTLKNFMCHSKLEFSFNPGTNIIYGKNGSESVFV